MLRQLRHLDWLKVVGTAGNGIEAIVRHIEGDAAVLEVVRDYRRERHGIWGIAQVDGDDVDLGIVGKRIKAAARALGQ